MLSVSDDKQEVYELLMVLFPIMPDVEKWFEENVEDIKLFLSKQYQFTRIYTDINYYADNYYDLGDSNSEIFTYNCEPFKEMEFQGGSYINYYKTVDSESPSYIVIVNEESGVTILEFQEL